MIDESIELKGFHWAQAVRGVNAPRKAVLFLVGWLHDRTNGACETGLEDLAASANVDVPRLERLLKSLQKDGFLQYKVKGIRGAARISLRLNFNRLTPWDHIQPSITG